MFINPDEIEEIDVDEPITGHIDLVQIRYDNLYILDYKPNLNRPERHASQLQLYKKAVQQRTSIPEEKIHTAVSAVITRTEGCNPARSTDTATTNSTDTYRMYNEYDYDLDKLKDPLKEKMRLKNSTLNLEILDNKIDDLKVH